MSVAEIIGLAASVIQIAELGGKLSVKIFTFTRKVKNANKTIDALSQEIAVTGAVLQQLGETLSNESSVKVCSQEAIDTAKKLVSDTEKVFKSLERLLDGDEKSSSKFRKAVNLRRLKFPFLESEIEEVQANLERLKSSLLIILNVLIFAEQLRNRETLPILEDQRDLIRTLAAEKDANEQRYERILKAIADRPKSVVDGPDKGSNASSGSFDAKSINSTTPTLINIGDDASQRSVSSVHATTRRVVDVPVIDLPEGLQHHHESIHHHAQLVQNLLSEIDCVEYKLDHSIRGRLQTGVLDIHWKEWEMQRRGFGAEPLQRVLANSSRVARYWVDKRIAEEQKETIAQLSALEERKAWEKQQNAWTAQMMEDLRRQQEDLRSSKSNERQAQRLEMQRSEERTTAAGNNVEAGNPIIPSSGHVPTVAPGLGTAALARTYDKNKVRQEAEELTHDKEYKLRSRSRSRARSRSSDSPLGQSGDRKLTSGTIQDDEESQGPIPILATPAVQYEEQKGPSIRNLSGHTKAHPDQAGQRISSDPFDTFQDGPVIRDLQARRNTYIARPSTSRKQATQQSSGKPTPSVQVNVFRRGDSRTEARHREDHPVHETVDDLLIKYTNISPREIEEVWRTQGPPASPLRTKIGVNNIYSDDDDDDEGDDNDTFHDSWDTAEVTLLNGRGIPFDF